MGKVKDKILKEAENEKKEIKKEASAKIKKITDEAKKEASDIEEKGKERAKEAEKTEKERILSRFRMELSNRKLNKKNEIMEKLKSKHSSSSMALLNIGLGLFCLKKCARSLEV